MIRILIAEDSSATRAYVRAALEDSSEPEEPVEVVEASNGFDAMRLLPRSDYDLVITDINMPDINGLELIKFLRDSERQKSVAILIISTQSSERDRERGLALGADLFLAKPFTPEALRTAVAASLAARRARPTSQEPA
jgi:two-component system, chemotaxis family, chemotaxis protein CheY